MNHPESAAEFFSLCRLSRFNPVNLRDQILDITGSIFAAEYLIDPRESLCAIFAELEEYFEGLSRHRPRSAGRGFILSARCGILVEGSGTDELVHLAVQRGDDGFRRSLADLRQTLEQRQVSIGDGGGDLIGGERHRTKCPLVADPFGRCEQLKKTTVLSGEKSRESGQQRRALVLTLHKVKRLKRHRLADRPAQSCCRVRGDEDFIGESSGRADVGNAAFNGFELTFKPRNHARMIRFSCVSNQNRFAGIGGTIGGVGDALDQQRFLEAGTRRAPSDDGVGEVSNRIVEERRPVLWAFPQGT